MAAPPPGGVIVLDDEDEGVPEPPPAPPSTSTPPPEPPPQPNGGPPSSPGPPQSGGKTGGSYKAENERLFGEFLELCTHLTEEHPEVIPFLSGRHQKASPDFLISAEFRNVLSRCLNRVRARRNKVYVYINELCTVLKAHTSRRKLALTSAAPLPSSPSPPQPPTAAPDPLPSPASPSPRPPAASKRQIRYLENLLRVYTGEIRRLQERELDLTELDSEDSTYLQESRLKRKMMRIFQRLCQLKQCSSLTGRVIEQRIQYRGTRYPEVNRRIERFINRPEVFPDYTDILKVIQKASGRHGLGLAQRQMENMAQDAFREVGNRLQERRHLDLVYNFGSHLTDQYRPGTDPALVDPELAKRLRKNRTVALTRLDDVISHYAQLQDEGEEEERRRKRAARQRGPPPVPPGGPPPARPPPESVEEKTREEEEEEESEEEESEEEEEEEEEDDDSSEADGKGEEEEEEEEEEERQGRQAQGPPPPPPPPRGEEEEARKEAPVAELFVLEIETLPLELAETPPSSPPRPSGGSEATPKTSPSSPQPSEPPQSLPPFSEAVSSRTMAEESESEGGRCPFWTGTPPKGKRSPLPPENPRTFENGGRGREEGGGGEGGGTTISSTSFNGSTQPPPCKRSRLDLPAGGSPCVEVHSVGEEEEEEGGPGGLPPPPRHSPLPDSTRADSPGRDLVSSSQGSPRRLPPKACKTSVATQCDPEEIIVLSDSD